jgi:hypothetical protein
MKSKKNLEIRYWHQYRFIFIFCLYDGNNIKLAMFLLDMF